MQRFGLTALVVVLCLFLLWNSAYLWSFATASIFYMGNVLAHVVVGTLLFVLAMVLAPRWRAWFGGIPAGAWLLLVSALLGFYLTVVGALRENQWALWSHILTAIGGIALLVKPLRDAALARGGNWPGYRKAFEYSAAALILLPVLLFGFRKAFPDQNDRIENALHVPTSMQEEGGGEGSPFWPSSVQTNTKGHVPVDFFFDSKRCGECHKDIYQQWESSMHHFSSFNNQFYRKSIEHMQEVTGTQPSRWCAGCHDHAVLLTGKWDQKPMAEQIDTAEAQAGLTCVSCHAITRVDHTMGNGGFLLTYPELHKLAVSENKVIRALDTFLTNLDPEPHRKTFLKPFMVDNSEFCSSCHKVHLDVPVNNYRWLRGFNDYDNWQASGVSGQGARSFYYPEKPLQCAGCHMPLVPSKDPGNRKGMVHSHRFAAANTAVAVANQDDTQLAAVKGFLQSGFISVDIFSASPVNEQEAGLSMRRQAGQEPQLMSTFAVGEESMQGGEFFLRDVGKVIAPLDRTEEAFPAGSTVRVDVVVRTRKIGHFFPGGTVDAFDVWLELQGRDADGRVVFWSGAVEEGGKGPVEPGAHFYRSYMLDGEGNPINKRNAWQTRSLLYVRLIPPGAADVAHYRVKIPEDARGPITLEAKLNYRKFSHYYTQFSYAGKAIDGQDPALVSKDHESRAYSFALANIPANVSGKIKDRIPDVPIVTLAQASVQLKVAPRGKEADWKPVLRAEDHLRWNDWGIGLLLQGDLKGAEYAFRRVTEAKPDYADGWLNVARSLVQEGETEVAKPFVAKALELGPELGRVHFFKAMVEKADGDYDTALQSLETVAAKYPRDRVVLNQMGRLRFLKRDYDGAIAALERVLKVDPEDIQAHYNLMLAYRGKGDLEKAAREEQLFRRFKADEASQTITARRRMLSPEDNNERQTIHDHESVDLRRWERALSSQQSAAPARAVRAQKTKGNSGAETAGGGSK